MAAERVDENNNVQDGGLGSLCWARWEVSRHLIAAAGAPSDDAARRELETLYRTWSAIRDTLASVQEARLPDAVVPFLQKLSEQVELAEKASESYATNSNVRAELKEQGGFFEFEEYPGLGAYGEAAVEHAACRRA